jgi:hypothetical protein
MNTQLHALEYELKQQREFCNKSAKKKIYGRGKSPRPVIRCKCCLVFSNRFQKIEYRTKNKSNTQNACRKVVKGDVIDSIWT